jgi:hypothetical protein
MASRYQEQVFRRKLLYIGLILALFTGSLVWRRYVLDDQASRLAIREESRGEVDVTGAAVRLALIGVRGPATCILWERARDLQMKNKWSELEVVVRSLTKLQPHFITPWLFQSWNLAYNVSVESDRVRDKYFYVTRGVELLGEGERQNRDHPDLRWSIGFYTEHKVCKSDETNVMRSLFDLSKVPPNERDPARFYKQGARAPEVNWAEFEKFCRQYPQLVRRLREGMHRGTFLERRRQFTCERPEDVIQFLEENQEVPGLYRFTPPPANVPADSRPWDPNKKDELLPAGARFPVLPPEHPNPFDPTALTDRSAQSGLADDVDGYAVAHAWYSYAQEPLPRPGELPGSSEEITDPVHQRKPRYMTTLIFRSHPAQARRFMAERLQQERWFDDEAWDITDWFEAAPGGGRREVKVGGGHPWSLDAWAKARNAWNEHGQRNHLVFRSPADEKNMRDRARAFWRKFRFPGKKALSAEEEKRVEADTRTPPPERREEELSAEQRAEYHAARFLYEWNFYTGVSNFLHHYYRTQVEARPETVLARKLFARAEKEHLSGSPLAALRTFEGRLPRRDWEPDAAPGKGEPLSPLEAWRELVLLRHKEFRRDPFIQEQTAEIEVKYLELRNRVEGRQLKDGVYDKEKGKLKRPGLAQQAALPLVPKVSSGAFPFPIVEGPFDVVDPEGVPLVDQRQLEMARERLHLRPPRQHTPAGPPGGTPRPLGPPEPARP